MLAISKEAVMRSARLCPTFRLCPGKLFRALGSVGFAVIFTLGCGTSMRDPKVGFGTSFTPPALMSLAPNSVPVNSTPFVMTVTGNNFGRDAVVFWNNVPQSTRFVSATQLQVSITADDLMQFGLAHVYVRTAAMTSNTVDFEVTAQ